MAWIIWLAAFVVLIGIEAATMALTTIWFAGGAIVAFLLALLGAGQNIQFAAFFIVSCALLLFTRPFALKFVNKKTVKTNVEGLIGKKARVTADVDNDLATGAAVISGQEWTARSTDGKPIKEGTMVKIDAVNGVKLIVSRIEEEK
ncbi:NfeD family protein [Clostridium transplantifaecale]|uniref:NfeD family protein n=1 Tax=Clostridium transplantifaecale TaxID=2479838 RepID=UPI000F6377C6|nr:NfeD family protein [Clostridium transplantifaecale]